MFDVFDLMATIKLDSSDYERGLSDAESKSSTFGDVLKANLVTKGVDVAINGFKQLGSMAVGVMKESVNSYKEYEQLVGGVETLFDNTENTERYIQVLKDTGATAEEIAAAMADANKPVETVMENAANAYKTAGMSANEYMATVTSMASALNQSTGDLQVSAEMADMAITDMSDNANKMGTSMESIQNAYQGFAKQNYTMLDNLKLGYGGTKEEMKRLLEDAGKLANTEFNIDSYADVVEAIHVVQTEMGITGTTAKEASETIAGSAGSVKAAWDNLIAGFANKDADLSKLIGDVVSSAEVALENMLPAFEQALVGIGQFVEEIAPIIAEKLPQLIDKVLPALIDAAMSLLRSVTSVLPSLAQSIITTLVNALVEYAPQLATGGVEASTKLIAGLADMLPELIPVMVDAVLTMVQGLLDNLPALIDAGISLIVGLTEGLINAIPIIVDRLPEIIMAIVNALIDAIPKIAKAGVELLGALVKNLPEILTKIAEGIGQILSSIVERIANFIPDMIEAGKNLILGLRDGIVNWGKSVVDSVKNVGGMIVDGVTSFFGINSPSKVFAEFGKNLDQGMAKGLIDNMGLVEDAVDDLDDAIYDGIDDGAYDDVAAVTTVTSTSSDDGYGRRSGVESQLAEILYALQNMGIYLDGTTLVGKTSSRMDSALGEIGYYNNREAWA